MVILIRKRHIHVALIFFFLICCAVLCAGRDEALSAMSDISPSADYLFVIDAGHGGEDGGAVAVDGTSESGINLEIALKLNDLLRFFGQKTAMIRTDDIAVNTPGLATFQQRKSSDLKNRADFVNRYDNAVLVSIHQNSLPSVPSVHGAQVFYNTRPYSDVLAAYIQTALNTTVNNGNQKHTRQIPDSIYLMKHSNAPSVLVECGFLSNAAETALLKQPKHQYKIAASILSGILSAQKDIL